MLAAFTLGNSLRPVPPGTLGQAERNGRYLPYQGCPGILEGFLSEARLILVLITPLLCRTLCYLDTTASVPQTIPSGFDFSKIGDPQTDHVATKIIPRENCGAGVPKQSRGKPINPLAVISHL